MEVKLTKFLALRVCELVVFGVVQRTADYFAAFSTALGTFSHFMSLFYCQRIFKRSFMLLR